MTDVVIKIVVDGITTIGKEVEENQWTFKYEDGEPSFYIEVVTEPDGGIGYEYEYDEFPGNVGYVSSTMFEGKNTLKDIAEWVSATYPAY